MTKNPSAKSWQSAPEGRNPGAWGVSPRSTVARTLAFAVALLLLTWPLDASAQQEPPKDDALDQLLEKVEGQDDKPKPAKPEAAKPVDEPKPDDAPKPTDPEKPTMPGHIGGGDPAKSTGEVAPKDEAIDSLLEKIGETTDKPDAEGKTNAPKPGDEPQPGDEPKPGDGEAKPQPDPIKEGDKAIDQDLEEQMGRVRKKKGGRDEDAGMLADSVKQMREVEKRLGEPDTGEETRQKQKQILKTLDEVLEKVRIVQSRSQGKPSGSPKPGDPQPGDPSQTNDPGAGAHNVKPVTRPKSPKDLDRARGNKDAWGQLPPDLQIDKANAFGERPLPSKGPLVDRYFEAVAKKATAGAK